MQAKYATLINKKAGERAKEKAQEFQEQMKKE